MPRQIHLTYLLLVLVQACHSIEEYIGRLWENFPPATFLCSLFSEDIEKGFLRINIGLFIVGIFCWYFLVRRKHPAATTIIWIWIVIELTNGVIHPTWAIIQGGYEPGVITAPFLFVVAILLLRLMLKRDSFIPSEG